MPHVGGVNSVSVQPVFALIGAFDQSPTWSWNYTLQPFALWNPLRLWLLISYLQYWLGVSILLKTLV
jgi:hypothetical protein